MTRPRLLDLEVMGMPWVSRRLGLTQAIPPAYTEYLGEQLIDQLDHDPRKVPA